MRKDRLLKLAELLEADAANPKGMKFDLGEWARPVVEGTPSLTNGWSSGYAIGTETVPVDCHTMGCALGLAAISGVFKDEGLTFRVNITGALTPVFDNATSYFAGARFFDVDLDVAEQLFSPRSYELTRGAEAELAVAVRIRNLVAGLPNGETF